MALAGACAGLLDPVALLGLVGLGVPGVRRGEVIWWRILARMVPASRGMVNWPEMVPSWLSCQVRRAARAARSSSPARIVFSWASTTGSGTGSAARARRAAARNRGGSNRAAAATSPASTTARSVSVRVAGQWVAAAAITPA